jgi:hypothetical protein
MNKHINRFWCGPHSKIYIADDCHGHLFELLLMHDKWRTAYLHQQKFLLMILIGKVT